MRIQKNEFIMIMNHKPTEPVAKRDIDPVTYTVRLLQKSILRAILKQKMEAKSKQR